jgi:hypothetical protein
MFREMLKEITLEKENFRKTRQIRNSNRALVELNQCTDVFDTQMGSYRGKHLQKLLEDIYNNNSSDLTIVVSEGDSYVYFLKAKQITFR